ncbi:hypothetical protein E9549_11760 [Blastococcus sp. MG754426]|uniref:hypothetical protein n=1 Tax=unclassified Blastococcus TaxID=2619396 RepID=UPI001EF02A06|nr:MULTISPECIES: hypothetical protein [unclassified Blastococcus]MCF6508076.1 hypothetical protein [Blastococcus sp. MG754426]MCF6511596.1 hypothetical protein [Blastococcus sp. MG754427]MCF6733759.1 hypothetical protein [Blastococcus sp. KM273129]
MTPQPGAADGRAPDLQVADLGTTLATGEQHTSSSADDRASRRGPEAPEGSAAHRSTRTEIPA